VFTGLSGSGKSSLAFDTIYAEGQRRYVESLSALRPPVPRPDGQARRRLHRGPVAGHLDRPEVGSRNPRSTVGTVTEVYDYLRLLFARIGVPHDPETARSWCARPPADRRPHAPVCPRAPASRCWRRSCAAARAPTSSCSPTWPGGVRAGARRRRDRDTSFLKRDDKTGPLREHHIEVIVDRLVRRDGIERRLTDSMETALRSAEGVAQIELVPRTASRGETLTFSEHLSRPSTARASRSWRPATSRSTRPTAPASAATAWAPPSRSTPSWWCPTPSCRWPTGRSRRGRTGHAKYFHRLLEAVAEEYGIDLDAPWEAARQAAASSAVRHEQEGEVKFRTATGAPAATHGQLRGVIPYLSAATARRRATGPASSTRATCARCRARTVRRRPAQAAHAGGDHRRQEHLTSCATMSIGDSADVLAA
jgi:excinuclease ABC subunit A